MSQIIINNNRSRGYTMNNFLLLPEAFLPTLSTAKVCGIQ